MLNEEIMHLIYSYIVFKTIFIILKQAHYKNIRVTISFYY